MHPEWLKLQNQFQQTVDSAQAICERLEHGEAHSPLGDQLAHIHDNLETGTLQLMFLSMTPEARQLVLSQLSGEPGLQIINTALEDASTVEIVLQDVGYGIDVADLGVTQVGSADELIAVLRSSEKRSAIMDQEASTLRLLMPAASATLSGLTILLPNDISAISKNPRFFSKFGSAANVLMLAGNAAAHLEPSMVSALKEILPLLSAVLPLVISEEDKLPASGWWNGPQLARNSRLLAEQQVGTLETKWNLFLTDPFHPLRLSLLYGEQCKKLRTVLEMAAARQDRDCKQILDKVTDFSSREKDLDAAVRSRDIRSDLDLVKALIEDQVARLQENIDDPNRKALQRRGKFSLLVRDMVNSVDARSLSRLSGAKTVRNRLERQVLDEMTAKLAQALQAQVRDDVTLLSQGAADLGRQLAAIVRDKHGLDLSLSYPMIDEAEVWRHLKGEVVLETRADFELQSGGFMYFVNAGRMLIMPIFMLLSMFGFARNSFPRGLLFLFVVIAVLHTVFSFRKERQEKLEKELEKLRDLLGNETTRVIADVQREKMARISAYLADVKKTFFSQVEDAIRRDHATHSDQAERERKEIRTKIKSMDLRVKDLQEQAKIVAKLQQACTEVAAAMTRLLVDTPARPSARLRA